MNYKKYKISIQHSKPSLFGTIQKEETEQRQLEETYFTLVNRIVDAGGIIDPPKSFHIGTELVIYANPEILGQIKGISKLKVKAV